MRLDHEPLSLDRAEAEAVDVARHDLPVQCDGQREGLGAQQARQLRQVRQFGIRPLVIRLQLAHLRQQSHLKDHGISQARPRAEPQLPVAGRRVGINRHFNHHHLGELPVDLQLRPREEQHALDMRQLPKALIIQILQQRMVRQFCIFDFRFTIFD